MSYQAPQPYRRVFHIDFVFEHDRDIVLLGEVNHLGCKLLALSEPAIRVEDALTGGGLLKLEELTPFNVSMLVNYLLRPVGLVLEPSYLFLGEKLGGILLEHYASVVDGSGEVELDHSRVIGVKRPNNLPVGIIVVTLIERLDIALKGNKRVWVVLVPPHIEVDQVVVVY